MFRKSILRRHTRRGAIVLSPYGGGTLVGSIGSTTFQRGRFGNLARQRVKPVDPNTSRQQEVKTVMALVSAEWNALAASLVAQWNSYALNTPITGPKGNEIVLTGRQMYMRARMFQLRSTLGPSSFPPSTPGTPGIPGLTFTYELNGEVKLTGVSTSVASGAIRLLVSRNLRATRNYWKGPFEQTFVYQIGDATPALIATITPTPAAGEKVFVKAKLWDATENTVGASSTSPVIAASI